MDIFFSDPTDVPLPPDEVRIRKFTAELWPDRKRVRVYLELTPFQKRPSGEIVIINSEGAELASINIVETMDSRMEFTLHMRGADAVLPLKATVRVFYRQIPDPPEAGVELERISLGEKQVVDQASTEFGLSDSE